MIGLMSKLSPSLFRPLRTSTLKRSSRLYSTLPAQDTTSTRKKTTILNIQKKYKEKTPITMVTAYDYTSAIAVDTAGIDIILVGDSLGMVMLGYPNTVGVTMDEMVHHCKAVQRGSKGAFLLGDMPFGSFEISPTEAARNATRLLKEGGMEAVKVEGGRRVLESVKSIVSAGIPVIGHIGLTPQTISSLGGFRVQGRNASVAQSLLEDAKALEEAGVKGLVIECVPSPLAAHITNSLKIPTIGIGAGPGTSGQVLVYHDMLGLYPNLVPKFSKQYLSLATPIRRALEDFKSEVERKSFPSSQHSYSMKEEEFAKAFPGVEFPKDPEDDIPMGSSNVPKGSAGDASKEKEVKDTKVRKDTLPSIGKPVVPKKKIAIIGGGSMGSLVGGSLASMDDTDVWIVSSWKEHVDKINRSGLTFQRRDASTHQVTSLKATTNVNEILDQVGNVDLAVVMVKSPFTKDAAVKASQLIHPTKGLVLTLQNGLGNREILGDAIGDPSRVIQGVTSHGGNILGSGFVSHTGDGYTTLAFDPSNRKLVEELAQLLSRAGFECNMTDALEGMQWGKLIVNSAINPLSAILRVKNGVLIENETCRNLLGRTAKEGEAVAHARGVKLPFDVSQQVLEVASATRENQSSMLKDVMRGIPTEVDSINGAIVREGERLGVEVFLNRTLCGLVGLPQQQVLQL